MKKIIPAAITAAAAAAAVILAELHSDRFLNATSTSPSVQENMLRQAGNAACKARETRSAERAVRNRNKASRVLAYVITPRVKREGQYFFTREEICKFTGEQRVYSLVVPKKEKDEREGRAYDVVQRGTLSYILMAAMAVGYEVAFSWRVDANGDSHLMGMQILAPWEHQNNTR